MADTQLLTDILNETLVCACNVLQTGICGDPTSASQCGCPCRLFVSAGPPVWDLEACCSDGQLTVHLEDIYQMGNFPSGAAGYSPCAVPLAANVVVTLLRCFPSVKDDGSAPSGPELQKASEDIYRDLFLLTSGLICCLSIPSRMRKFVFKGGRIVGPDGGCIGAEVKFSLELLST